MREYSRRIAALSTVQREYLKKRLKSEGLDFNLFWGGVPKERFLKPGPVEKRDYYPLSAVQKRMYLLNQFDGAGTVYNVTVIRMVPASLGKADLEELLGKLMDRHESFRTSFHVLAGEPVQVIHSNLGPEIEYYDKPQGILADETMVIMGQFVRPFDLTRAPLLRAALIFTGEENNILVLDTHHIVSDQASKRIVTGELTRLINNEALPALDFQYKDFAVWCETKEVRDLLNKQEKYWLSQFKTLPPSLNLPTDFPRPVIRDHKGAARRFMIGNEKTGALRNMARAKGTTLFSLMLAVYYVLLGKICLQEDVVVGIPVSGRHHTGLDGMVGMFVNTLAIRQYPTGTKNFSSLLDQVKKTVLEAQENQDWPFDELVNRVVKNREPGRNPIFDAFFTFSYPESGFIEQEEQTMAEGHNEIPTSSDNIASMFDIYLYGVELKDELFMGFTYARALFRGETVETFIQYFQEILDSVIKNEKVLIKDIAISHNLGTAKVNDLDDDEDFGF